jgi:hypothetical protein
MILPSRREISMAETTALSPQLGARVTGVENLPDEAVTA